ncbi:MAG: hypothetical protein IJ856_03930 [Candidatus Methanomethylophilaceae archaeon]|nr:hypothetical protein [Candidatus Methanomethylophilaceae archaeon]
METEFEMDVRRFLAGEPFGYRGIGRDDLQLFCSALTHDSFVNEPMAGGVRRKDVSYERLEFLGDAVLELIACGDAYYDPGLATEGAMTDFKQARVANHVLSEAVLRSGVDIDGMMRVGGGHVRSDGSKSIEEDMRADSFEAILGAVYLVFGLDEARNVVHRLDWGQSER